MKRTLGTLVLLFSLLTSVPVHACEMVSPLDFVACFEAAINGDSADTYAFLLSDDYTERYVSEPTTVPIAKDKVLENWSRMRDPERVESMAVEFGGALRVTEIAPGSFKIDGIESQLELVALKMSVGEPGRYTVKNWATWYLRSSEGGYQMYRAEYWTHDPVAR